MNRPAASRLGKIFIALVWAVTVGLGGAAAAELALFLKWDVLDRPRGANVPTPNFDRLRSAYAPFDVQHINPIYLFFFPFDTAARVAMSTEVTHLTADGYRGPGPDAAGDRQLAFMLGGSAVFGEYASHDSTTITGYLNRLQDQYFFVNAGVPSWNSTQELARLAFQLLETRPQLVVAYDGANDFGDVMFYHRKGVDYPPGVPESFDDLDELVGDIRGERRRPAQQQPLAKRVLPRLSDWIARRAGATTPGAGFAPIPDHVVEASARKYVYTVSLMNDLVSTRGARFVGVFQPIYMLHRHAPDSLLDVLRPHFDRRDFVRFHDYVMRAPKPRFEYLDCGALFDATHNPVPLFVHRADLTESSIFVDAVHLADAGNRRVAEALWEYLRKLPSR